MSNLLTAAQLEASIHSAVARPPLINEHLLQPLCFACNYEFSFEAQDTREPNGALFGFLSLHGRLPFS